MLKYLLDILLPLVSPDQVGFRKSRHTSNGTNRPSWTCSADKNAFFSPFLGCREGIWQDQLAFYLESLEKFAFTSTILSCFLALYSTPSSRVLNNKLSTQFNKPNGTRKGCPLSHLIFVVLTEIFAQSIRSNTNISGV